MTFARTVGQLYHLAALGLPVPGRTVALHAPDAILTHFDRGDRAGDLTSRLEDEVERMAALLATAGERSVVILNEMFSSTTWVDARAMSSDVLRAVLDAGAVGVCVTFIDELSRLDPRIVSLTTGIDAHDATRRTFEVTRGRADGEAHALALAAKYGLTTEQLRARIEANA
ncbi:MutS-related protein [Actinoplanes sp. CA-131856]